MVSNSSAGLPPFLIYPAVSGQKEEFTYYVTFDSVNKSFTVQVDNCDDVTVDMPVEQFFQTSYLERILSSIRI